MAQFSKKIRELSRNTPPKWLFLRNRGHFDTWFLGLAYFGGLPLLFKRKLASRRPANIGHADGQAVLPFGAALARAHCVVALGVCGVARALSPRVDLWGPLG